MVINIGEIMGTGLKIGQDISPHDGKLDLAIASPQTVGGILRLVYRLLTRRLDSYGDLKYFLASRIRITATPPLEVQVAGRPLGRRCCMPRLSLMGRS